MGPADRCLPYITGLVAGAFILASLERVFNVKEVQPTYRLSLLTALAFLIIAPLPLLAHLGHPERSFEMFLTPNLHSAMAMFGFVYAWYLTVVLLLEIWFDYRKDRSCGRAQEKGLRRAAAPRAHAGRDRYVRDSLRFDRRAGRLITLIGIPSAFLLHGYVGFIFGSVKANPWWSSVLIPIVFLFSAIVSGIALVLVLHADLPGAAARRSTCLRRQAGVVPALRADRGLLAGDAGLHSPPLRGRGIHQDPLADDFQPPVPEPGGAAGAAGHAAADAGAGSGQSRLSARGRACAGSRRSSAG